ncbi:carboxypeptidase regulatory-like domain-containing protein [Hirsutella rhossiliensis]|uniref:Carboxypeptidase regulatory-like domain-containing protein n=1 Tax=Hirsutella rhossiliensis TaxID=111463 RepID=A0A9P8SJG5_9HYPO|nr:carboxypeptidase regulatory-like domain-containing protein [Hirsutella rhossiliensis]KAH0963695.1 carboxypeptidase regulatory-like domain-containing protein [Hirsutella rhossiliensis]
MFGFGILLLPVSHALGALNPGLPTAVDTKRSSVIGETASSVTGPHRLSCTPTFVLDGVAEDGFNKPNEPFIIRPSCNSLDTESHAVFMATGTDAAPSLGLGVVLKNTVVTPDGIVVSGLGPGFKAITVAAKDDQGSLLVHSFALLFGSISMPVKVVDEHGKPVPGANVTAESFPGIRQHGVTDNSGTFHMSNLPAMSIELSASTADKRIGSADTIATSSTATLKLLPSSHPISRGTIHIVKRNPVPGVGLRGQPHKNHAGCVTSPGRAICQPTCQSPPPRSCNFYTRCAEKTLQCGQDGYPLRYGAKNCRRFVARLDSFSPQGQAWIWRTMLCLERALVEPISGRGATCESVKSEAFQSHPRCYVDSGFCDLPLSDIVQVVVTVKSDLFEGPALEQALTAAGGCARHYALKIKEKIDELRGLTTGGADTAARYDTMAVFEDVEAYLEKFGSPDLV